ncbi:MAG: MBL fold metallo-hydrolase [Hyphomonas sp.]|nr:MBL fold metallo-hydrolase [Hyphomonas sp.]
MSKGWLKVTILGCGSSGGVPRIDGDWGACDPSDPRNRRTRCGLLVQRWESPDKEGTPTTVLVDTSPDLREQLLKAGVTRIDGILYTHDHADQTHGIDDVRAIVYAMGARIPCWMDAPTTANLTTRFGYIFESAPGSGYPALLDARPMPDPGSTVRVDGPGGPVEALVMAQQHGTIPSLGFRFGPVAYCNDASDLPPETLSDCRGSALMIVDALRYRPHPSHAHVARSLEWIERVRPEKAVLTNLHIDLDFATLAGELPEGVEPAVDGWSWEGAG